VRSHHEEARRTEAHRSRTLLTIDIAQLAHVDGGEGDAAIRTTTTVLTLPISVPPSRWVCPTR
jgi:hypothetical protein